MKRIQTFLACIAASTLFFVQSPAHAAPTYHYRSTTPFESGDSFDGQAYYASRYVPSLRPHLVVGTILLIGVIVVILQNSNNSGHAHS